MKKTRATIVIALVLAALPLAAREDAAGLANTRADWLAASARRVSELSARAVPAEEIGDWGQVIDATLFLVCRRAEIYRGRLVPLVVDSPSVLVELFPDGTFAISTATLDYIDERVFEEAGPSPRRMKSLDSEREALLAPFVAIEASRYALDLGYASFARGGPQSVGETHEADRLATLILAAAGYQLDLAGFLSQLSAEWRPNPADGASRFSAYLPNVPSPRARTDLLAREKEGLVGLADEVRAALSALRSGRVSAETVDSLRALGDVFPGSRWAARLEAIALHARWLATAPRQSRPLETFLPLGAESAPRTQAIFPAHGDGSTPKPGAPIVDVSSVPGDESLWRAARDAYVRAVDFSGDYLLSSAYAALLARSSNPADRARALEIAASAAAAEQVGFAARANYASILFLSGTDRVHALFLAERADAAAKIAVPQRDASRPREVSPGLVGDTRLLAANRATMLALSGKADEARKVEQAAAIQPSGQATSDAASSEAALRLRGVAPGDAADSLSERWGRPTSIRYDYESEYWFYPGLRATVSIGTATKPGSVGRVESIVLGDRSPVSLVGDLRVGDSLEAFERELGPELWRVGDLSVRSRGGLVVSVLFVSGTARLVSVSE
jgi:hypothetical protein